MIGCNALGKIGRKSDGVGVRGAGMANKRGVARMTKFGPMQEGKW